MTNQELENSQRLTQLAMFRLFKYLLTKYSKKKVLKDIEQRIEELINNQR